MIPAELPFRPDFFGLISGRFSQEAARGIGITMVKVQSVASPAIHADERLQEVDHPTSKLAQFGADQPLRLDCGVGDLPRGTVVSVLLLY